MSRSRIRKLCFAVLAVNLSACVGTTAYWEPSDYTVRSGDTLYSIAWRYELDPDDLARWNNLGDSSLIRPGDRLHTRGPGNSADQVTAAPGPLPAAPPPPPAVIIVGRGDTLYSLAHKHNTDVRQLIQANHLSHPYRLHPGQKLYTRSQPLIAAPPRTDVSVTPGSTAATPETRPYPAEVHWGWPLHGRIISRFNNQKGDAKGIDIAGNEGDAVHAAAAGKVVYSGNGLISFGNLVIIKHNDAYLSAYAYNRKLLVDEGEQVKVGQVIAEIGKTDANNPVLHFEIRKHGKPVDPLRHLPPG